MLNFTNFETGKYVEVDCGPLFRGCLVGIGTQFVALADVYEKEYIRTEDVVRWVKKGEKVTIAVDKIKLITQLRGGMNIEEENKILASHK